MADETTPTGQVGTDTQVTNEPGNENPVVPNPDPTETPPNPAGEGGDGGRGGSIESLPKWAQEEIRKTREEAARRRVEAKEREEKARLEAMSETERAVEEARTAERVKFEEQLVSVAARGALAEAGVENPARSVRLLNLDSVEINDHGEIKGLDEAIQALVTEFPVLVKKGTNPGVGNQPPPPAAEDMNTRIRRAFGRS